MSYNGSGTFVINSAGQPVVANTVISATTFNALTSDLANGLTTCITKDGQTTPTANIPMGGFKITNLATGTAATDAATVAQIQSNGAALVTVTGTDTLTGSLTPALVAYVTGAVYYFVAPATNTGAVTLNIDTLGAKNVTRDGTTALVSGDIVSGEMVAVVYDGTRFQLISPVNSFTNLNVSGTLTVAGATTLNGNLAVGDAAADTINFKSSGWTLTNNVSVIGTWADIGTITTADINGGTIDGTTIGGGTAAAGTFTTVTATTGNITTVNATTVDSTNLEVTNLKAKDGTAAGSIADATGVVTLNSVVATTADINGGTIDATTIGGSSPAVGNFTTVSAASAVFTTATITTVNTTTLDLTNLEVTNIKAKDGTASMTIDDATGKVNVTTVSAASMNAGVAAVTSLTATGASVASANVGTAVITNGTVTALTATGASIASMNAGVALLTTATVTNFTASGASIASANIGNLQFTAASIASINAGVAVITNLTATGASIASANVGTAVITAATVTGASIASMNAGVALLTTATVTNLTATGASIASANVGTLALTRLDVTAVSVASANAGVAVITTGTVTNLTSTSASIASMNAGVALLTTATVTNLTATGASVASANVGTAVITTGTVTNLTSTSASIASANAAVALITTGTVTNLTSTSASIASANVGTAVVTGLTVTGASIASINAGTATISGNLTLSGGTANGVAYLNGSKVLTSGTALTFDGTQTFGLFATGNAVTNLEGSATNNAILRFRNGTTGALAGFYGNNSKELIFEANGTTEQMRLTSTGLGIGTASPAARLNVDAGSAGLMSVFDSTNANGGYLLGRSSGTAVWDLGTAKQALNVGGATDFGINVRSGFMAFGTNNTERMRLDSSGQLGLGVTPSAWSGGKWMQFVSTTAVGQQGNGTANLMCNAYESSGNNFSYIASVGAARYNVQAGTHAWFTAPSGTAGNAISFTQAMTLNASGFLGVGATSQPSRITIEGTNGAVGSQIQLVGAGVLSGYIGPSADGLNFGTDSGGLLFRTGVTGNGSVTTGTERARIDASGNFDLGTTGGSDRYQNIIATSAKLTFNAGTGFTGSAATSIYNQSAIAMVFGTNSAERARITSGGDLLVGDTSGTDARVKVDGTGNAANCAFWGKSSGGSAGPTSVIWNNATSGDNKFIDFYTEASATLRGSITYNRAGGLVAYNVTSDYRAKDILGPVQNSGATIDALKVYEGQMKGASQSRPMLVAHEAQEHAPYTVTGEKDAVNEDGTPKYQQMDVSALVPLLLAELQSLRKRVAELESK